MTVVYALKYGEDGPTQLHVIHKPEIGESGFYRQTVSIDAFRNREIQRTYKEIQRRRSIRKRDPHRQFPTLLRYTVYLFADDWRIFVDSMARAQIFIEKLPTFQHESVWAFYDAIGYDHRKNRFAASE